MVEGVLAGKSKTDALRSAGYSEKTSRKQTATVLGRARVQTALLIALEENGLSDDLISSTIIDGLKAKVVHQGVETEAPDHNARHKYLNTIIDLRGDKPDRTIQTVEETYEERLLRLHAEIEADDDNNDNN